MVVKKIKSRNYQERAVMKIYRNVLCITLTALSIANVCYAMEPTSPKKDISISNPTGRPMLPLPEAKKIIPLNSNSLTEWKNATKLLRSQLNTMISYPDRRALTGGHIYDNIQKMTSFITNHGLEETNHTINLLQKMRQEAQNPPYSPQQIKRWFSNLDNMQDSISKRIQATLAEQQTKANIIVPVVPQKQLKEELPPIPQQEEFILPHLLSQPPLQIPQSPFPKAKILSPLNAHSILEWKEAVSSLKKQLRSLLKESVDQTLSAKEISLNIQSMIDFIIKYVPGDADSLDLLKNLLTEVIKQSYSEDVIYGWGGWLSKIDVMQKSIEPRIRELIKDFPKDEPVPFLPKETTIKPAETAFLPPAPTPTKTNEEMLYQLKMKALDQLDEERQKREYLNILQYELEDEHEKLVELARQAEAQKIESTQLLSSPQHVIALEKMISNKINPLIDILPNKADTATINELKKLIASLDSMVMKNLKLPLFNLETKGPYSKEEITKIYPLRLKISIANALLSLHRIELQMISEVSKHPLQIASRRFLFNFKHIADNLQKADFDEYDRILIQELLDEPFFINLFMNRKQVTFLDKSSIYLLPQDEVEEFEANYQIIQSKLYPSRSPQTPLEEPVANPSVQPKKQLSTVPSEPQVELLTPPVIPVAAEPQIVLPVAQMPQAITTLPVAQSNLQAFAVPQAAPSLWDSIKTLASNAWQGVKNLFKGIASWFSP